MKKALISVSDKSRLIELATGLIEADYEIISTGNTYKYLIENNIEAKEVSDITNFKEMLDGRVKTLHPFVHGGILARRDVPEHMASLKEEGIPTIDLVCVNLYPFKSTIQKENVLFEDAIENIDIGGPTMLRSAAKNFKDVTVICDLEDYDKVLNELKETKETSLKLRQYLALKVFNTTANYDALITEYLKSQTEEEVLTPLTLTYDLKQTLRYGENPHQKASLYTSTHPVSWAMTSANLLHGKELSYNNIQDGQAALGLLSEFTDPTCVVLKHMNPCGVASADSISQAFKRAYEADPISIFGGIVAFNGEVDADTAQDLHTLFLEVILAPSYTQEALDILTKKKNLRVMTFIQGPQTVDQNAIKIPGGLLVQDMDITPNADWTTPTITTSNSDDLEFAQKIVKHVKSNAIVLVKDKQTVGIGAGQMNRVGAALIACEQAQEKAKGSVVGSDAFFPMRDTVDLLATYGVSAIVQPGGSLKDQDSIDACNEHGIAMIFTSTRHFKH